MTVDLDVRTLPGFTQEDTLREIWDALGGELEHEVLAYLPAVESEFKTELFDCISAAVEAGDPGARAIPFLVPGMTDAQFYRRMGTKCYGFMPLLLNPRDADEVRFRMHGHDERVSKDAFMGGYAMLESAVFRFLGI